MESPRALRERERAALLADLPATASAQKHISSQGIANGNLQLRRADLLNTATPLTAAIESFLMELRVERGLSPLTIEAYRRDLAQFAEHAGGERWRDDPGPLNAFVAALQRAGAKGTTQARKSAAVRSFYAFALREGHATRDIPALIDAPRPGCVPAGRAGPG